MKGVFYRAGKTVTVESFRTWQIERALWEDECSCIVRQVQRC